MFAYECSKYNQLPINSTDTRIEIFWQTAHKYLKILLIHQYSIFHNDTTSITLQGEYDEPDQELQSCITVITKTTVPTASN